MSAKIEKLEAVADFSLNVMENNQVRTVSVKRGDKLSFDGLVVEGLGMKGSAPSLKSAIGKWLVAEGSAKAMKKEEKTINSVLGHPGVSDVSESAVLAKSLSAELPPSVKRRVVESSDDYIVRRVRSTVEEDQNPASVVIKEDSKKDRAVVFEEERVADRTRARVVSSDASASSDGEVVRKVSAPPARRTVEVTPSTSTEDNSTSKVTERVKTAKAVPSVNTSDSAALGEFSQENQGAVLARKVSKGDSSSITTDGITSKVTISSGNSEKTSEATFSKVDEGSSGEVTVSAGEGSSIGQDHLVVGKVGQRKAFVAPVVKDESDVDIEDLLRGEKIEVVRSSLPDYKGIPWEKLHWSKKVECVNTLNDLNILKEILVRSNVPVSVRNSIDHRIKVLSGS